MVSETKLYAMIVIVLVLLSNVSMSAKASCTVWHSVQEAQADLIFPWGQF